MRIRYLMIAAMALMLQIIPSVSLAVSAGDDPSSSDLSAWSSFRSCGYLSGASNRTTNVKAVQDITSVYSPTTRSYIMDNGGIDGSFGIHTKSAVFHIQRYYDLHTDGEVGPNTWEALCRQLVVKSYTRTSSATQTDFEPDPNDNQYSSLTGGIKHVVTNGLNAWQYKYSSGSWYNIS